MLLIIDYFFIKIFKVCTKIQEMDIDKFKTHYHKTILKKNNNFVEALLQHVLIYMQK